MQKIQRKFCDICQDAFEPDHRVGERQRVCKKLRCQRERKRRAQQRWQEANPDYFKDDYPRLKGWLKTHPDYLRNYRAGKQTAVPEACLDIQDKLSTSENKVLSTVFDLLDIQDEISSRITAGKRHLRRALAMIYKTSEAVVMTGVNRS